MLVFIGEFRQLMRQSKVFYWSVVANFVFVLISILFNILPMFNVLPSWMSVITLYNQGLQQYVISGYDFSCYFQAANNFIFNVDMIFRDPTYLVEYRHIPLLAILFIPFLAFGFNVGYWLFSLVNFVVSCYLSYRIYKYLENKKLHSKTYLEAIGALILLNPIQVQNYWLGQTTIFVALFLFLSYENLIDRNNLLKSGIYFALAVLFKPYLLSLLFVLLPVQWKEKKLTISWKKGINFYLGLAVLVLSLGIFFLINPSLLSVFIGVNSNPVDLSYSQSFTYFLSIYFGNLNLIFIVTFTIASIWILYERIFNHMSFIFCFMFAIFNSLLFFTTSWIIYQLIIIPFIIIGFIETKEFVPISSKTVLTIFGLVIAQTFIELIFRLVNFKILPLMYLAFYIYSAVKIKQGKQISDTIWEN